MEVIIKPCGSLRDNKDLWSYFNIENISDLSELSQQMFKYTMMFGGQEIEIKNK